MRRVLVLLLPLLAVAACAQDAPDGAAPGDPSTAASAFERRAGEVLDAWRAGPAVGWAEGFVPLQDLTVVPGSARLSEQAKAALLAGSYRAVVPLPEARPDPGTIRFADGATLSTPLVSAADAFRAVDQGGSPCRKDPTPPSPRIAPKVQTNGPDMPVSSAATPCVELTVTAVRLGSVTLQTSRGQATVPAWLFTVEQVPGPVVRVAVAPGSIAPLPSGGPMAPAEVEDLVAAQDLVSIQGARLTYRLGVGACDEDITPLVHETNDAVVVGGAVTRRPGVCTEQLLLHPVTVTLAAPVGGRPVLDALNGNPLTIAPR